MPGSSSSLSKRDRALAELVKVRGWADDAAVERAVAEASSSAVPGDLGSVLVKSGVLSPSQVKSLEDAIEGRGSKKGSVAPSAPSDRTITKGSGVDAPPPVPASGIRRAPDTIGPYRILRELGRGGMGVVYRALDPELRREVALKVMIAGAQASDGDVERFRREAAVVARMGRHPHLVQIHDIGRDGERLYFTMDFIEGRSAKQRVDDEGAFPPRDGAGIGADIAGALAFAHKAGVVHRDVKPHNILLDRDGKGYLGDFGLAKDLTTAGAAGLTESGSAFGTPAYMPPEQAVGQASKATELSDVYALGATLYEMVSGKPPFTGESGMDIVRKVLDTEPDPPRTHQPALHRDLEVIILKAMHKSPSRRYASASDLEADLRRFLSGEPIHARPASFGEKLATKARRHRAVISIVGVGLLVAAGIGGWAGWRIKVREKADRDKAADRELRAHKTTPMLQEGKLLIDRADAANQSGGWKDRAEYAGKAVTILREALAILPDSDDLHFQLGRALRRAGRREEALAELTEAVRWNPRHSMAWFEHGTICQEQMAEARGTLLRRSIVGAQNELGFAPSGIEMKIVMWTGDASEGDARLRATAAEDFRQVANTGAVSEGALYGKAMLLFLENKHEQALEQVDRALADNKWYVDALRTRAEILETWKNDPAAGAVERETICRLQPRNPEAALEFAQALIAKKNSGEASKKVLGTLEVIEGNPALMVRASELLASCGKLDEATRLAKAVLAVPEWRAQHSLALTALVRTLLNGGKDAEAAAVLDRNEAVADPDWLNGVRGEMAMFNGEPGKAITFLRKIRRESIWWRLYASILCAAEHACGNLGLARETAEYCIEKGKLEAFRMMRGLIRMDEGDSKGARADFEEVRRLYPKFNSNLSNLAAALFLEREYAAGVQALEDSVMATEMTKAARESAKTMFEDRRTKIAAAKTPAQAAAVVNETVGALLLASIQIKDKTVQAATREGARGLLYVLQQFYAGEKMWAESIAAADRYLGITRTAAMYVKDARVRALSGDSKKAIERLGEAMKSGFDDGARLDGDAAFESLRNLPEYQALRKACRS